MASQRPEPQRERPLPQGCLINPATSVYKQFLTGKTVLPMPVPAKKPPSVTRMSSKGQVVIPEPIRKQLGLEPGTRFLVVANQDAILLKEIEPPSIEDFDELLEELRTQARAVGLKQSDVSEALEQVRKSM